MHLGMDPEFVIVNKLGRPIPAHKAGIPGPGEKRMLAPDPATTDERTGKLRYNPETDWQTRCFRDGYMVEFNVRPQTCRQSLTHLLRNGVAILQRELKEKGLTLAAIPAVRINLARDMKDAPPDVMQFGCKPSLDAYNGEVKIPPIDAISHPYRYAGGHMHFGYSGNEEEKWMLNKDNHADAVKLLDLYLGLPLTALFNNRRTYLRRRYYGQAGEYRSQQYLKPDSHKPAHWADTQWAAYVKTQVGIEYRTPGPEMWNAAWVASFAYGVGRFVMTGYKQLLKKYDRKLGDGVRAAINTGYQLDEMLKYATLVTGNNDYPTQEFLAYMVKSAPSKFGLLTDGEQAVTNGFRDWAYQRADLKVATNNGRYLA